MNTSSAFRTLVALALLALPSVAAAQSGSSQGSESTSSSSADSSESTGDSGETEEESEESTATEGSSADDEGGGEDEAGSETDDGDEAAAEEGDAAGDEKAGDEKAGDEKAGDDTEETTDGTEGEEGADRKEADAETAPPAKPPKEADETQDKQKKKKKKAKGQKKKGKKAKGTKGKGKSPISDLAESTKKQGFEPVEDIEESDLEEIEPAEVYPYLEWDGHYRLRTDAAINFDLDTQGTSAVRPPIESYRPGGNPANPDAEWLWGANTALRLDPSIHISEMLRVHTEVAVLDNVVLGSLSDARLTQPGSSPSPLRRPDPTRTVFDSNQMSPREREWFENALQINELYGELDTFVGTLKAGRMDDHWGLGMYANDGDCPDCDYGDHVDRIQFRTKPLGLAHVSAAIDFPDQGITSQSANRVQDQPRDRTQIDDARQYTFSIFRKPLSKKEKKLRQKKLQTKGVPVVNGGARFTYRQQKGVYVPARDDRDTADPFRRPGRLVYRGLNLYVPDLWGKLVYHPKPDTYLRVELETVGVFGDVDNATRNGVSTTDINCFNDSDRESNPEQCSGNSQGISQFGAALESELYLGGPVRFGLNLGYASGGNAPNWGYRATGGNQHQFFRFDPNYHVDLIMFREVIGSVTNAYYANPYAQARFFESADQRVEVQLDAIVSRASNVNGTPAGPEGGGWLGLELDGAVRYLQLQRFIGEIEGGVLFPFGGLGAQPNRPRLTQFPTARSDEFGSATDPTIPWTLQANMTWKF